MKVDLLRLIEDALIGGRNGEMAFIENNPLIAQLYIEYINSNKGKCFKDFLNDCLKEHNNDKSKQEEADKVIVKSIEIKKHSEEYREYHKAQKEVSSAKINLEKKKKELAKSLDNVLYKISSFEVKHHEYCSSMEFKIPICQIKSENNKEEG